MTQLPMLMLVHSPLVGPSTWEPVATRLRQRGYLALVPSLVGVMDGDPPYYPRLAEAAARTAAGAGWGGPAVLVGHSAAGALLPAIAGAMAGTVHAAVLVDAVLPHPGASWFDTAPPQVREQLSSLARAGRIPPWNKWFPPGVLAALLPGADMRERFTAELPEVPLAYFEEPAPKVDEWPPRHCVYVQLSEAYEQQAGESERRGWLVHREDADHLAMLTRPDTVANVLDRLVVTMASE